VRRESAAATARTMPHPLIVPSARVTRNMTAMADTRNCEQCGSVYAPRREHARFCSARCRVAWNRENTAGAAAGASALDWSMSAMRDATGRLLRVTARDRARLFAVVSEAVWWVTIVDATLVRYHPDTYDGLLTGRPPADRRMIEETLAGLRFVRNRMGQYLDPADFIRPAEGRPGGRDSRIRASTWKSVPKPELAWLPSLRQDWEMTRYRAYEAQLAGHSVGETFELAAAFLKLAAAEATPVADARAHAAR
jgi:hypothetical protein